MDKDEQTNQATELIELSRKTFEFFIDERGGAYAWWRPELADGGETPGGRVMSLTGSEFKSFLASEYYRTREKAPSQEGIGGAVLILTARAQQEGVRHRLWNRYAWEGSSLLVDLADGEGQLARIEPERVSLEHQDEPRFRRFTHQQAIDIPQDEGSVDDVRKFIRLFGLRDAEDDEVLLAGSLGADMVPDIPQSITAIIGEHGAAKTTLTNALVRLNDPSAIESFSVPTDPRELIQILSHHHAVGFDNVNAELKDDIVDLFCRATSGGGISKRQLYTDDDDVIYTFKDKVYINGLNQASLRGDFMDRTEIIELEAVAKDERKTEAQMSSLLANLIPKVRNAYWHAISKAMGLLDEVKAELKFLPRNADHCVWGEAIARALGYDKGKFYGRLMKRSAEASRTAINDDPLAGLIMKLIDGIQANEKSWDGTTQTLLSNLKEQNVEERDKYGKPVRFMYPPSSLPPTVQALGIRLNNIKRNLREAGYTWSRHREGAKSERFLTIRKTAEEDPDQMKLNVTPPPPPSNANKLSDLSVSSVSRDTDKKGEPDKSLVRKDDETDKSDKSGAALVGNDETDKSDKSDKLPLKAVGGSHRRTSKQRTSQFFRCMDCGAGVYTDEKECTAHKALKGNERHNFLEFDTIQAANKYRPGGSS